MLTLYHGSPTPGLTVIEPRMDPRLGIMAAFVSDEPFGPMVFALLPDRSVANVDYRTEDGKFIEGIVQTPAMNDEGWLYALEAEEGSTEEPMPGVRHLMSPAKVILSKKVSRRDIEALGWKVDITKQE